MAKGRKNGCPVNIANWLIYIADKSIDESNDAYWVRIHGMTSLTRTTEGDTEDSASDVDAWSEPYVTKRSGSLDLEGKLVINETTGDVDEGQELLNDYGEQVGCEGDATLKFIDPYGHGWVADYIVTSVEESADDSESSRSWSLEQVGEAENIPYIQVTNVSLSIDNSTGSGTSADPILLTTGDVVIVKANFTPNNASNQRFRVANKKRSVARISDISTSGFTLTAFGAGETTVGITTINNAKQSTLYIRVQDA